MNLFVVVFCLQHYAIPPLSLMQTWRLNIVWLKSTNTVCYKIIRNQKKSCCTTASDSKIMKNCLFESWKLADFIDNKSIINPFTVSLDYTLTTSRHWIYEINYNTIWNVLHSSFINCSKSSIFRGILFSTFLFTIAHKFSMGFKSGLLDGHSSISGTFSCK